MRLQSAVFVLEDAVLDPAATPEVRLRKDLDKVLSILNMEGVWMYAVTALTRGEALRILAHCGISERFRGILTAEEARASLESAVPYEKAARRLRSHAQDTMVFASVPEQLRAAKQAGFRTAAVKRDEASWTQLAQEADETVSDYSEYLQDRRAPK